MYQLQNFTFPKNFIFGVADADLQVIGEEHTIKNENSEPTAWTYFAENSDVVFNHQTPLQGIDRYHKWQGDIAIMQQLGVKHYRTSVSMSRIMTKDGKPNQKALDWYKTYFETLRKAGITVYATIYHWELPQYLSEKGGWKNREITNHLVNHATIVYNNLNDFIEEYFILNEPFQFTFESYHNGVHAPGEKDIKGALKTVHHALLAQGLVYQSLRSLNNGIKLSTVYNPSVTYAATEKEEDRKAAEYAFSYHTSIFTDPLYLGKYPNRILELFEKSIPVIEGNDMKIIKIGDKLNAFGVNYYRGKTVRYDEKSETKFTEVKYPQGITNGLGWPVNIPPTYPEAFYDLLTELYHRYVNFGMKQIYISENGTCWNDQVNNNGEVNDEFRIFYLHEHLKQIEKAILAGVPINAYFLWTLMDNYEWDLGYKPGSNFGIVHIERKSMQRIPKKSFYWYKNLITTRKLE